MPVIACKLPAGLTIKHEGQSLTLAGSNIGENLELVSPNGSPNDNARRIGGFGLTEVTDKQAEFFEKWAKAVTYVDGDETKGKVGDPFPALDNGSIVGPFKSMEEARRECSALSSMTTTGFEGLDPEKEGTKDVKIGDAENDDGQPATRRKSTK